MERWKVGHDSPGASVWTLRRDRFGGKDKVIQSDPKLVQVDYKPMLEQVLEFFRTGKSPVPETETLNCSRSWMLHNAARNTAEPRTSFGSSANAVND